MHQGPPNATPRLSVAQSLYPHSLQLPLSNDCIFNRYNYLSFLIPALIKLIFICNLNLSSEANSHSTSQEIPRFLSNPKVY